MTTTLSNAKSGTTISRRSFVIGTGTGAIGISFGAAVSTFAALNATAQTTSFTPIAWVNIAPNNTATIYSPGSEMGQGTMTALPIVIAENMELDWAKCKVVHAPADPKRFGNPKFGGGMFENGAHVTPPSSERNSPCGEVPAYQTSGSLACAGVNQNV